MFAKVIITLLLIIGVFLEGINCIQICTEESQLRSAVFGEKLEGEGLLIETLHRTSLMVCSRECFYQTNCLSFNFNTQTGQCELNRNLSSISKPLITSPGFLYAEKSDWMNLIRDPCRYVSCLQNEKCIIENDGGNCTLYDCGVPPEMTYSDSPKYAGTVSRHYAIYSCFGPGVVREDVTLTCNNGSWEGDKCRKISTCSQIKLCNGNYTDGEYWTYPLKFGNTHRVKIYCHGLNTIAPREYITLPKGNEAFHSNLEMEYLGECNLRVSSRTDWGESIFARVRVEPDTMTIIANDFLFAQLVDGVHQHYGRAYDCSRLILSCDKVTGYFSINTTNTGLIIDETMNWKAFGWTPHVSYINRSSLYVISANCGGYCGGCKSENPLNFVLDPNSSLDDGLATEVIC